METPQRPLGELVRLFVRLGLTSFGGPAAHISMMHDEVVTRRGWLDDQRFLDLIGVTNLIPGPNSTEMAMHVGQERAGWRGLVTAGASFIVPAALIVLAFAWAYVEYGNTPSGEALLYGIKPVVVMIVGQALIKLGRSAIKEWLTGLIGTAATAAYLLGFNELTILAIGGVAVLALRSAGDTHFVTWFPMWEGVGIFATTDSLSLGRLFGVFLKAGAFLFGSGYVLLAFLHNDLVSGLEVLTEQQLLDAIAIGQFTPGPVFTTATFIGYLLGGWTGAAVATVGIFLPSFVFVAAITRLARRVRERSWTSALLDGINAAALGLMAGVTFQLGTDALADPLSVVIGISSAVLLWRTRVNTAWLIAGGGVVGLLAILVSSS
ncbi:MAG TPA: chromate efflux transporter [Acidimicrobiia bacterium]|nr:chromate efflux transporter [Acidimicrobiia bacterium]